MIVCIHLFGPEAATLGASFVDVPMSADVTCEALLHELKRLHPQIAGRIAVNHAFAAPDQPVREGDEVALIGLVSGG